MSLANDKASAPVRNIGQLIMIAARVLASGFQNVVETIGCRFASGNVLDAVVFVGETGPGADYDSVVKVGDKYLQVTFSGGAQATYRELVRTSEGWQEPALLPVPVADNTAGALTLTTAMVRQGLLLRDPNGGARSDVTPTAAQLVAAFPGCKVGDTFIFRIVNTADANEVITLTAGTNVTLWPASQTVAQNAANTFIGRFTNVTSSSEAVTIYRF